jgi:hypothetical protein
MKAYCEKNHERVECYTDHVMKRFYCPVCGHAVAPEIIMARVPRGYQPQIDPIFETLRQLMDFEIVGVIQAHGQITIEYPRGADVR